jgi:hypothetical protein
MSNQTRAYWPTRIMLACAFLAPIVVACLWLLTPTPVGPPLIDPSMEQPWVGIAVVAIGVALWLIGTVWMVRIFRGPRDEPPPWRYRDDE